MLNDKKVPCVLSVIRDNTFFADFSKNTDLLNSFLAHSHKKPSVSCDYVWQDSAQLLEITVSPPHQLIPLSISTWQTLNSRRIILNESSLNSIIIKLTVMIWLVFACWKCPATLYWNLFSQYSKCGMFLDD